jgi:hypothetical protein
MPLLLAPSMRVVPKTARDWDEFFRATRVTPDDGSAGTDQLANDSVTNTKLRNSGALSVIGRSADTTGDPADISATVDNTLLIRRSTVLGFGALVDADIPATIARDAEVTSAVAAEATARNAAISTAISTHEAAGNPHPTYLTQAEGDALYVQETTGSFTATLTGCTTSPTGTISYVKIGKHVTLNMQASISGTSNTTAATLTGLPAAVTPVTRQLIPIRIIDNGVIAWGLAKINTDNTITLYADAAESAFTNSGTKAAAATTLVYSLD